MTLPIKEQQLGETTVRTLAAGWYIALPSNSLGSKPRKLELFDRNLVAWRDGRRRPVIMSRYCPHLSASLALGKVVDGTLRCSFHHWRFDSSGVCVEIPDVKRVPPAARSRPYPVVERCGFIWAWYGSDEPQFPLPEFPAFERSPSEYLRYGFSNVTPASPRRILENAFDYHHFMTLHHVRTAESLRFAVLTDQDAAATNGPPIARDAWFGALLELRDLELPRPLTRFSLAARELKLLVDGWPGGQRLTFLSGDQVIARELLGVSPVSAGCTVFRGWTLVRRQDARWKDLLLYLTYRAQHLMGTKEDLRIYRNADDRAAAVPVRYDDGVLRFRKYYQGWVERADPVGC